MGILGSGCGDSGGAGKGNWGLWVHTPWLKDNSRKLKANQNKQISNSQFNCEYNAQGIQSFQGKYRFFFTIQNSEIRQSQGKTSGHLSETKRQQLFFPMLPEPLCMGHMMWIGTVSVHAVEVTLVQRDKAQKTQVLHLYPWEHRTGKDF